MPAGHDISYPRSSPAIDYQDGNSFVVEGTGLLTQLIRLILDGLERASLTGTARIYISDALADPSVLRTRAPGSVSINTDEYVVEFNRVAFYGNARKTLYGTARVALTDLKPIGRLVLSGQGGGS